MRTLTQRLAVGMSTSFEVIEAAHCGMAVLGLSLITNEGIAPGDVKIPPTHAEVLTATEAATQGMQALVATIVGLMKVDHLPVPTAAAHFTQDATPLKGAVAKLASPLPAMTLDASSLASVAAVAVTVGALAGALAAIFTLKALSK